MKRKNTNTRKLYDSMLDLCGDFHEDDGIDPKFYFRRKLNRKGDRKTKQLCQQATRTLSLCLNDCDDPIVQSMYLVNVTPAPDSSCLMVIVECDTSECQHTDAVLAIRNQTARLQFEISRAIHRKRVPNLIFSVSMTGGSNNG